MDSEIDDLDAALEAALGLANTSLERELAPPDSLFAAAEPEVDVLAAGATAASTGPAKPGSWAGKQAAALADGEANAEQFSDGNWDDDPL